MEKTINSRKQIYYHIIESPAGKILLLATDTHLAAAHFLQSRYLPEIIPQYQQSPNHSILKTTATQLKEYFQGKRTKFDIPIITQGTIFQEKVWKTLTKIPFGTTTSYKSIAQKIKQPTAIRAVGTAIGKNPISIIIPCHRIIKTNGDINQYAAGTECKKQLLLLEQSASI